MSSEVDLPVVLPPERQSHIYLNVPINVYRLMGDENRDKISFATEKNGLIKDIDLLYSTKWFKRLMYGYIAGVICEYCLFFLAIPFESVHGRPSLCVIQAFYFLFLCLAGSFLYVKGSAVVPSKWSYLANIWSFILQSIAVILTMSTLYTVLLDDVPYEVAQENSDGTKVFTDISGYVEWISIFCVISAWITFVFAGAIMIIYAKGYYRLSNRIHKLTTKVMLHKRQFNEAGEDILNKKQVLVFDRDIERQTIIKDIEDIIEMRFS